MSEDKKQCRKCGEWKLLGEFYRDNRLKGGRQSQCKSCSCEYQRKYHQDNKEAINKRRQLPEAQQRRREYVQANKQSINRQRHKYRQSNKESIAKWGQEYRQRDSIKVYDRIRANNRRSLRRSLPDTLTPGQWQHCLNYFNGCCAICGRQLNDMFGDFKVHSDHWVPLSYGGDDNPGTTAKNTIPLCKACNLSKRGTMPDKWIMSKFGKRKAKAIMKMIQAYFDSLV